MLKHLWILIKHPITPPSTLAIVTWCLVQKIIPQVPACLSSPAGSPSPVFRALCNGRCCFRGGQHGENFTVSGRTFKPFIWPRAILVAKAAAASLYVGLVAPTYGADTKHHVDWADDFEESSQTFQSWSSNTSFIWKQLNNVHLLFTFSCPDMSHFLLSVQMRFCVFVFCFS